MEIRFHIVDAELLLPAIYPQREVKTAMMAEDRGGRTCLLAAARSGDKGSLESVVDVLKGDHLMKVPNFV